MSKLDLTRALDRFERVYVAAVAQPGAPVRLIQRARLEILQAIEDMPEGKALVLLEECERYIRKLSGYRNGTTPSAVA